MTMTHPFTARRGMTLVELLVTIAILGVLGTMVTLAFRIFERPRPDDPQQMLTDSVHAAIATGRSITFAVDVSGRRQSATALPDGSVVADSGFLYERLSGRRTDSK
jgi:prepilin-type N-terminal cleavage/methylation domain-containing protein